MVKKLDSVLITGANGMLARNLEKILSGSYHVRFLTRSPESVNEFSWDLKRHFVEEKALENIDHIVHLAGANIGEGRWTPKRKKEILDSRVLSAKVLLEAIKKNDIPLRSFISASAVGYYGMVTEDTVFTEDSPAGHDFLSEVCQQWEDDADAFSPYSERVVKLRFGAIVSRQGGIVKKMYIPARFYLNAVLGSGKQYIPWIDIDDASRMIEFCLSNPSVQGVYNAVSPHSVTNRAFTLQLTQALGGSVILPRVPPFLLQLIYGEMASLLIEGTAVSCQKITDEGFHFLHANLQESLQKEL